MRPSCIAPVLVGVLLTIALGAWAQERPTWKMDASGLVRIMQGDQSLAAIELNAHGPNWKHAPQQSATAQVTEMPGGGNRVVGTLPIPETEGGTIRFVQVLRPLPGGFELEYDLVMDGDMRLNGVQVSLGLSVAQYAGTQVMILRPDQDPEVRELPIEHKGNFQIWRGDGATLEVATGTPQAMVLQFRAAADVVIQDLRSWDQDLFEVRFPAVMEEPPRQVFADDRLHRDFTVTFPEPAKIPAEEPDEVEAD